MLRRDNVAGGEDGRRLMKVDLIKAIRLEQYREHLKESGDENFTLKDFENLVRNPGISEVEIRRAGGFEKAHLAQLSTFK
jgi:hypothetical protein